MNELCKLSYSISFLTRHFLLSSLHLVQFDARDSLSSVQLLQLESPLKPLGHSSAHASFLKQVMLCELISETQLQICSQSHL